MRSIKFRIWKFCHGEDKYKFYYLNGPHFTVNNNDLVFSNGDNFYCDDSISELTEGQHIQQFTGLTDAKGNEIYEGDIIEVSTILDDFPEGLYRRKPGIVEFKVGCFKVGPWRLESLVKIEVIGNYLENSELCKET